MTASRHPLSRSAVDTGRLHRRGRARVGAARSRSRGAAALLAEAKHQPRPSDPAVAHLRPRHRSCAGGAIFCLTSAQGEPPKVVFNGRRVVAGRGRGRRKLGLKDRESLFRGPRVRCSNAVGIAASAERPRTAVAPSAGFIQPGAMAVRTPGQGLTSAVVIGRAFPGACTPAISPAQLRQLPPLFSAGKGLPRVCEGDGFDVVRCRGAPSRGGHRLHALRRWPSEVLRQLLRRRGRESPGDASSGGVLDPWRAVLALAKPMSERDGIDERTIDVIASRVALPDPSRPDALKLTQGRRSLGAGRCRRALPAGRPTTTTMRWTCSPPTRRPACRSVEPHAHPARTPRRRR